MIKLGQMRLVSAFRVLVLWSVKLLFWNIVITGLSVRFSGMKSIV